MTRNLIAFAIFPQLLAISAWAGDCYESTIEGPSHFKGVHGEICKAADGSLWEVQHEYEYLEAYDPTVLICPERGELVIEGKVLRVARVGAAEHEPEAPSRLPEIGERIESIIDGSFDGWEGETIVKLANGQVWQQREGHYAHHYAFMPKVVLYRSPDGYRMKVDGVERAVAVVKLN